MMYFFKRVVNGDLVDAVESNNIEWLKELIQHEIERGQNIQTYVNKHNSMGITPLHKATLQSNFACAVILLNHGANPNQLDTPQSALKSGPLHSAGSRHDTPLIELLIAYGANPLLKDWEKNSARSVSLYDELMKSCKKRYQKCLALQALGDEKLRQGDYMKATETYLEASRIKFQQSQHALEETGTLAGKRKQEQTCTNYQLLAAEYLKQASIYYDQVVACYNEMSKSAKFAHLTKNDAPLTTQLIEIREQFDHMQRTLHPENSSIAVIKETLISPSQSSLRRRTPEELPLLSTFEGEESDSALNSRNSGP